MAQPAIPSRSNAYRRAIPRSLEAVKPALLIRSSRIGTDEPSSADPGVARTGRALIWMAGRSTLPGSRFAEDCYAAGRRLLQTASTYNHNLNDPEFIAVLLLIRTLSNFKAAITLTRLKMVVEARILTRCCFENMFTAFALKEQGRKFVKKMDKDRDANRRSRGEFLLEHVGDANGELQAFLRTIGQSKTQALNPRSVATTLGPVVKGYAFYAQLSADAGHPGLDALERYVDHTTGAPQVNIEPVVDNSEIRETLNLACEAMIGVCVAVTGLLGAPADPKLPGLIDAVVRRSASEC